MEKMTLTRSHSADSCEGIAARVLKFEAMIHYFPEEIIHDILFRLPIKCLIKCTSVCKSWRSIIINPSFIHAHLSRTINSNDQDGTHLLLLHGVSSANGYRLYNHKFFNHKPKEELYSLHYDNHAFEEYCKIKLSSAHKEILYNSCFRVVGICNGLLCLADLYLWRYAYTFIIWNPHIRKSVTLPKPNVTFSALGEYDATVGFCFDAMTNDYKVVRLVTDDEDNPTFVEVYSLATALWSSPRFVSPKCRIGGCTSQAFVNGALHWEAQRLTNDACCHFILAFDVGNETFREIMMPKSFQWSMSLRFRLSVSGDGKSIALFTMDYGHTDSFLDIWVMKEYCKEESWTKLITLGPQGPERRLPEALCFRKSGEVVLVLTIPENSFERQRKDKDALVSLDLVSQQYKNLGISGYKYYSLDSYEESLVLLDKTDAVSY